MPAPPEAILGLSQIAGAYEALLCDIWGVLHDGVTVFAPALQALGRFRALGGAVVLISNSPRPSNEVERQLLGLGASAQSWSAIVSSGDVTRTLLKERAGRKVWAVGPERDAGLYLGIPLEFTGPEAAEFVCCSGPVDDETETPEDYREAFAAAVRRGLPMICANPDRQVQRGERLIWCAGALAELYETLGGRVVTAGKPFPPIYREAVGRAEAALGRTLDRRRILALGDGLATDVAGAEREGLDCLFIANGVHAAELAEGGEALEQVLRRSGAKARYALAALLW